MNERISQLSVAVGTVQDTVAPQTPSSAVKRVSAGMPEITGFVMSGEHDCALVVPARGPASMRQSPTKAVKRRIGTEFGTSKVPMEKGNSRLLSAHTSLPTSIIHYVHKFVERLPDVDHKKSPAGLRGFSQKLSLI